MDGLCPPHCPLVISDFSAIGLRTALWRYDLGAELPLVAVFDHRASDPKRKYTASFALI